MHFLVCLINLGFFEPIFPPWRWLVVAADGDGAVRVVEHVVTDAAEDRATNEAEPASSHHDHRGVFTGR